MNNRGLAAHICAGVIFTLSATLIALAQAGGTGGGQGTIGTPPVETTGPELGIAINRPIYISGKVVMAQGGPLPESVVIQRVCANSVKREANTDSKGNFNFMLGDTATNFQDASEGGTVRDTLRSNKLTVRQLQDCELRAVLPGYLSTSISLSGRNLADMPDIGTIVLSKTSSGPGDSISATSFAAPKDAKKAYEKGREAFDKRKYEDAEKQLTKAVTVFPDYAMAWDLLGRTQEILKHSEEARKSYDAAVKADNNFVLPYLRMAVLASYKPDWNEVLRQTEKLLSLDPVSYPYGYYLRGAAYFNLGNLPEAETAALKAVELDRQRKFPLSELLAGKILANRGNHAAAISHFQAFLRMDPNNPEGQSIQEYIDSQSAAIPTTPTSNQ